MDISRDYTGRSVVKSLPMYIYSVNGERFPTILFRRSSDPPSFRSVPFWLFASHFCPALTDVRYNGKLAKEGDG